MSAVNGFLTRIERISELGELCMRVRGVGAFVLSSEFVLQNKCWGVVLVDEKFTKFTRGAVNGFLTRIERILRQKMAKSEGSELIVASSNNFGIFSCSVTTPQTWRVNFS